MLAKHYTSKSLLRLKRIYDMANLKWLPANKTGVLYITILEYALLEVRRMVKTGALVNEVSIVKR